MLSNTMPINFQYLQTIRGRRPIVLLLLPIVLSVLLRYTDSDYPFYISKLFLIVIFDYVFSDYNNICPSYIEKALLHLNGQMA
jgi:hypothetical protein